MARSRTLQRAGSSHGPGEPGAAAGAAVARCQGGTPGHCEPSVGGRPGRGNHGLCAARSQRRSNYMPGGIRTVSMICTVPLPTSTLPQTTAEVPLISMVSPASAISTVAALDGRLGAGVGQLLGVEALPGDHVVGQDLGEGARRVGQDAAQGGRRDLGEGVVGRGEDGERALAVERVAQAGGGDGRDERRQRRVVGGGGGGRVLGHTVEAAGAAGGHGGATRDRSWPR